MTMFDSVVDLICSQRELDAIEQRMRAHWADDLQIAIMTQDWDMVRLVYASISKIRNIDGDNTNGSRAG